MRVFTPGPWQVKRLLLHPEEIVAVGDADGWFVADCQTTARPSEEIAANACLIAAAPELLEACKLALFAFETRAAIDWGVLEAAIAKATAAD